MCIYIYIYIYINKWRLRTRCFDMLFADKNRYRIHAFVRLRGSPKPPRGPQ